MKRTLDKISLGENKEIMHQIHEVMRDYDCFFDWAVVAVHCLQEADKHLQDVVDDPDPRISNMIEDLLKLMNEYFD